MFLYGRLILILLSTELISCIKSNIQENEWDIEISEWKTMKLIKKTLYTKIYSCVLFSAFIEAGENIVNLFAIAEAYYQP